MIDLVLDIQFVNNRERGIKCKFQRKHRHISYKKIIQMAIEERPSYFFATEVANLFEAWLSNN